VKKRGHRPEVHNRTPFPGEINAGDVQALLFDATTKGEGFIARLALEALEYGRGSDAWERCARILTPIPFKLVEPPIPYRLMEAAC
jgi:hypothetical protein